MDEMTQSRRLELLVRAFLAESDRYTDMDIPSDDEGRRRLLRSLMNVRMPRDIDSAVIRLQDEYLSARAQEKGVVTIGDIPTIRQAYGSDCAHADVLSIWQGDITRLAADAIVNAANSAMLGCFVPMHTCIDNCIHTFAGVQLREECMRYMDERRRRFGSGYEQPTAEPVLTGAYNLPAKKVIHIVGPIIKGRLRPSDEQQLADCYSRTLDMCAENGLKSVAFCCISTGVFRYPADQAARTAVDTVTGWLDSHDGVIKRVIFNVFKDEDKKYYEHILS